MIISKSTQERTDHVVQNGCVRQCLKKQYRKIDKQSCGVVSATVVQMISLVLVHDVASIRMRINACVGRWHVRQHATILEHDDRDG